MKHRPFWQGALLLTLALAMGTGIGIFAFARSYSALIEVKGKSLMAQGEAVAALIGATVSPDAGSAGPHGDTFPPERVVPILRRLVPGPDTRARVYALDGTLLYDSAGVVPLGRAAPVPGQRSAAETLSGAFIRIVGWFVQGGALSSRTTAATSGGDAYPEVRAALAETMPARQLLVENGEEIVSVAVPIFAQSDVRGVLLLSTRAGI